MKTYIQLHTFLTQKYILFSECNDSCIMFVLAVPRASDVATVEFTWSTEWAPNSTYFNPS
jgi:hypothetical protein